MSSKFLYITYDGLTDPLGRSQIIPYLTSLAGSGYSISVISAEKKYAYTNSKVKILKILKDHNIKWHPVFYTKKPYIFSTLWDIIKIRRKAKLLHKKHKFEVTHCRSYIPALTGLYLKKKYAVKFIFDMRGFYPDERIEGNTWKISNPVHKCIYRYFKRKENDFLKSADTIVCLTEKAKEIIYGNPLFINNKPQVEVIPCCADFHLFCPVTENSDRLNEFRTMLGMIDTDFILSYSGSTGTWYMLDEMLRFFKCLSEKRENARFLIITQDNKTGILKQAYEQGIPKEKMIIASAEREEMPFLLGLSDLSVFFIKPVFSKKASSPTKMAELMAMGIPFISNRDVGDINEIIEATGAGMLVRDFSDDEYYKVIDKIDDLLAVNREKIINSARKLFSLQKGGVLYGNIYRQLSV